MKVGTHVLISGDPCITFCMVIVLNFVFGFQELEVIVVCSLDIVGWYEC